LRWATSGGWRSQPVCSFTKLLQKYDESKTGKLDEEEFAVMLQVRPRRAPSPGHLGGLIAVRYFGGHGGRNLSAVMLQVIRVHGRCQQLEREKGPQLLMRRCKF
jgi:hypothetical protein